MNICNEYTVKRVNKDFIKVSFVCQNGNGYSHTVKDRGFDLRNISHKYLIALDALHELQEKGYSIISNFK